MGYGLRYARGDYMASTGIPVSSFSKGDILMLDSGSSLSRIPVAALSSSEIAGIAMADSLDSLDNQVPYVVVLANTVFTSAATIGSQYTPGEELDFEYTGGRFFITTSVNSAVAVIAEDGGSTDMIKSDTSEVLIRFILNSGYGEYL